MSGEQVGGETSEVVVVLVLQFHVRKKEGKGKPGWCLTLV